MEAPASECSPLVREGKGAVIVISAADFAVRVHAEDVRLEVIEQLGIDGRAITRFPVTGS